MHPRKKYIASLNGSMKNRQKQEPKKNLCSLAMKVNVKLLEMLEVVYSPMMYDCPTDVWKDSFVATGGLRMVPDWQL